MNRPCHITHLAPIHLRPLTLAFTLALTLTLTLPAQTLYLSDPITVADGGIYGNLRPQIALDRSGDPIVVWGSTIGGRKAYATNWNGSAFNLPQRINPNGTIAAYSVEGPNVATAGDTVYVVYSTAPMTTGKGMLRSSFDAGATWNTPVEVDSLSPDMSAFINVTADANGNPVVLYIHHNSAMGEPRQAIRRSFDGGLTFAPEVEVSTAAPGTEVCDCCTGKIYAQPSGDLFALFRNNANNLRDMWATRSTDGGLSFPLAIDLDTTDWLVAACPSSGPSAVFGNDSIRTVFMSEGGDGFTRVYLSVAHIDSLSPAWNQPLPDPMTASTLQNYPAIAGNPDTLGIVYLYGDGVNPEVHLAWSTSGTIALLSNPTANVSNAAGSQTTPDIAFRNGVFHMVWANNATGDIVYRQAAFFPLVDIAHTPKAQFNVSPHPVLHATNVEFGEILPPSARIEFLDLHGRVLNTEDVAGKSSWRFNRERQPSGLYFLRLQRPDANPATRILLLR